VLWTDDGPHFVDFDDSRMGPAVQDLWMLLSGDRAAMNGQLTDLLAGYRGAAGIAPAAERGRELFTTTHGREWSCASCHGPSPTQQGRHAGTGKLIAPLAPASNGERFIDAARAEKWFRRNCSDVLSRECTAAEKADVLAWLMTLKP